MSLNWDAILDEQAKDPGFAPVPESRYPVRVTKAEATKAQTGADMIKLEMVILGGPYDTKKLFTNIVFTTDNPTAMKFTLRKLAGLGVTKEIIATQKPSPAQIAAMVDGVVTEAEVTIRNWNDEDHNDVKMLRPFDGPIPAGTAPASTSSATPSLPGGGAASGGGPGVPTIPTPTPPAAPASETDNNDEEPF